MNLENFNELKKQVNKDLLLTDMNVLEMTTKATKLYTYYLDKYCSELDIYKKLKVKVDFKYAELYKKFKENYNVELGVKEIEIYIRGDADYCKIRNETDFQGIIVDYLENVLKELNVMGYKIKNHIDLKVFLAGGR